MCLLKRARINSVCNYNSSWWRNSLQLIQRVFRRLADQTRPLKHTTWTPSYHFNHTLCRQDTNLRWRWWRIWWWWWCVFAGWSESSTAPRTALRVSTLSPLTDKQWDPFRVNPTQQSEEQTTRHVKTAAKCSPLKLWQRFPAVKSLLVHRAPPSWSLFSDAPCAALWD